MKTTNMNFSKTASMMALFFIIAISFSGVAFSQELDPTAWYGDGTANEFSIGTAEELAHLAVLVNGGTNFANKIITLKDNIDLSGYTDAKGYIGGWTPIGDTSASAFRGTFDGNGKKIENLTINRSNNYQGLFGFITGGVVKNLAIENVNISGGSNVGGVSGYPQNSSIITNTYVTGSVSGTGTVGGMVGTLITNSKIENCYSLVEVESSGNGIGGIAGVVNGSTVRNCYSTGHVIGRGVVGGIAGHAANNPTTIYIENSAALNEFLFATASTVGRIVGQINASVKLTDNFSWEGIRNNYNGETFSGTANDTHGSNKTSNELINNPETWSAFSEDNWLIIAGQPPLLRVFIDNENIEQIALYPEHLYEEPVEIRPEQEWYYKSDGSGTFYINNAFELAFFAHIVNTQNSFTGNTVILTADIDFNDYNWKQGESELDKYKIYVNATTPAYPYDGNGWIPIGGIGRQFSGTFDGNGHVIRNLYINRTTVSRQGLFGSANTIINLGMIDANVTGGGSDGVGIIAGGAGMIENCFTTGSVHVNGEFVGGIIGRIGTGLKNSYSTADVYGSFSGGISGTFSGSSDYLYSTTTNSGLRGGISSYFNLPNSAIQNAVVLNAVSASSGRVIGVNIENDRNGQTLLKNYAWDGLIANNIPNNTNYPNLPSADEYNGADVTADEIYSGIVWDKDHANYPTDIWIIEKGKLPILRVFEEKNDERGGVSVQPNAIPDYIMAEVTPEVPDPEKSVVVSGMNRGFQIGLADEFGAWIHEPVFPDSSEIEFIVGYEEGPFTLWLGIDSVYPAVTVANIQADEMFNVGDYFYDVEIPEGVSNVKINFPSDGMEYVPVAQAGDVIALLKTGAEARLSFEYNGIQYGDMEITLDGRGIFPELDIVPPVTLVSATPSAYVTKLNGNKNDLTVTITETYSDGSTEAFTKTFSINNNAAGTYDVGEYIVYVDTKGNTQIRECYIVK